MFHPDVELARRAIRRRLWRAEGEFPTYTESLGGIAMVSLGVGLDADH